MNKQVRIQIRKAYSLMLERKGFLNWWPGDGPNEICLGAILTQNTSWTNVEKALDNLRHYHNIENVNELYEIPSSELELLLQPSGYFRIKTKRVRNFLADVIEKANGCVKSYLSGETRVIRERLLAINGIGPETADSILLYAGTHPIFVVDAYTKRIFSRHFWCDDKTDYHQLQSICHQALDNYLPQSRANKLEFFQDFHAQLVVIGHYFCKTKNPLCHECPLGCFLKD